MRLFRLSDLHDRASGDSFGGFREGLDRKINAVVCRTAGLGIVRQGPVQLTSSDLYHE
jgi:hypothetical protein